MNVLPLFYRDRDLSYKNLWLSPGLNQLAYYQPLYGKKSLQQNA
jgi:hypothetical protein